MALAHPDEPYMQKYGRFGAAPVPRSRTRLKDAALQNLLPYLHLYPARLPNLRKNAKAENHKRYPRPNTITEDERVMELTHSREGEILVAIRTAHSFRSGSSFP